MAGIIWSVLQEDAAYRENDAVYYNKKNKRNERRSARLRKQQQREDLYQNW